MAMKQGKKTIYLSTFLVLVLLSASVYIMLNDKVKIDVQKTNTKFYVYENDNWVLSATEYVYLWDGSTKMRAKTRFINYSTFGSITEIIRTSLWKDNITTQDQYIFDSTIDDITKVPIRHKLRCLNCEGKIVSFEYRDIEYNGKTEKITSPFEFGHNMNLEWESGAYFEKVYQQITASDKIIIKYKPKDNDEEYSVRLFDPPPPHYCYQESAVVENQTGIDGDCNLNYSGIQSGTDGDPNIYISYIKPTPLPENSKWKVKMGSETSFTETNLSIPSQCWDSNETYLNLRLYSRSHSSNGVWSGAYCNNGTDWISLLSISSPACGLTSCTTGGPSSYTRALDGNWNTGVSNYQNVGDQWVRQDSLNSTIWEEAIYWLISYPDYPSFTLNSPTNGSTHTGYIDFNVTVSDNTLYDVNVSFYNVTTWNLDTFSGDNHYYDIEDNFDPARYCDGIFFNKNGTHMFSVCSDGTEPGDNYLIKFSCTNPYNLTTCSYNSNLSLDSWYKGLYFSHDGTKIILGDYSNTNITKYVCSIGYNLSTCTKTQSINTNLSLYPSSVFMTSNGTQLYYGDAASDDIYEYKCSVAWDLSTCNSFNYKLDSSYSAPSFYFKDDGTKLYIVEKLNNDIFEFLCTNAFDLSTCTYDGTNLQVADDYLTAIYFTNDGFRFFVIGGNVLNQYKVYSYKNKINLWGTSYDISDGEDATLTVTDLSANTSYAWLVIADDGTENTYSSVWYFTTGNYPVTISSDILGDPFVSGTLIGVCNVTDADDDSITYYYKWYLDDVLNKSDRYLSYCYQESANIDNQSGIDNSCSQVYTGSYSSNFGTYENDGDYSTSQAGIVANRYVNYTKPLSPIGAYVQVRYGTGQTHNVTIPRDCWDYLPTQLNLLYQQYSSLGYHNSLSCENSTGSFKKIDDEINSFYFYEEGIYWQIPIDFTQGIKQNISNLKLTKSGRYIFSCLGNDGVVNSSWLNSSSITVFNDSSISVDGIEYASGSKLRLELSTYFNFTAIEFGKNMYLDLNHEIYGTNYTNALNQVTDQINITYFSISVDDTQLNYTNTGTCIQPTATGTTTCGGLSGGSYSCDSNWLTPVYPCSNTYDNDYSTFGYAGKINITYKIPSQADISDTTWVVYHVKYSNNSLANYSYSIPLSCWDYDNSNNITFVIDSDAVNDSLNLSCYTGTGYELISFTNQSGIYSSFLYEEAMSWNLPSQLTFNVSTHQYDSAVNLTFDILGLEDNNNLFPNDVYIMFNGTELGYLPELKNTTSYTLTNLTDFSNPKSLNEKDITLLGYVYLPSNANVTGGSFDLEGLNGSNIISFDNTNNIGYLESWDPTWSVVRGATTSKKTQLSFFTAYTQLNQNNNYHLQRGLIEFDTSSLNESYTVNNVSMTLNTIYSTKSFKFTVQDVNFGTNIGQDDYNDISGTLFASTDRLNGDTIYLSSDAKTDISKTGVTQYIFRDYTYDYLNSAPTGNSNVKLVVTSSDLNVNVSYYPSNLWIEVGEQDGDYEFNHTGLINTSYSFDNMTGAINDYLIDCTADSSGYCNVPIYVYSDTIGDIGLSNIEINYTTPQSYVSYSVNSTLLNDYLSEQHGSTMLPISIQSDSGLINVSNITYRYRGGNKTYTLSAHNSDYSINRSLFLTYYYSRFDVNILPQGVGYWDIGPNIYSYTQQDVQPYGNENGDGNPFYNITSLSYGGNIDIYIKYNQSLGSSCAVTSFNGYNYTNSTETNYSISTSNTLFIDNITYKTEFDVSSWTDLDCESESSEILLPYFCFSSMCEGCYKTKDWDDNCGWVG